MAAQASGGDISGLVPTVENALKNTYDNTGVLMGNWYENRIRPASTLPPKIAENKTGDPYQQPRAPNLNYVTNDIFFRNENDPRVNKNYNKNWPDPSTYTDDYRAKRSKPREMCVAPDSGNDLIFGQAFTNVAAPSAVASSCQGTEVRTLDQIRKERAARALNDKIVTDYSTVSISGIPYKENPLLREARVLRQCGEATRLQSTNQYNDAVRCAALRAGDGPAAGSSRKEDSEVMSSSGSIANASKGTLSSAPPGSLIYESFWDKAPQPLEELGAKNWLTTYDSDYGPNIGPDGEQLVGQKTIHPNSSVSDNSCGIHPQESVAHKLHTAGESIKLIDDVRHITGLPQREKTLGGTLGSCTFGYCRKKYDCKTDPNESIYNAETNPIYRDLSLQLNSSVRAS